MPTPRSSKAPAIVTLKGRLTRYRFHSSVLHRPSRTKFRALTMLKPSSEKGDPLKVMPRTGSAPTNQASSAKRPAPTNAASTGMPHRRLVPVEGSMESQYGRRTYGRALAPGCRPAAARDRARESQAANPGRWDAGAASRRHSLLRGESALHSWLTEHGLETDGYERTRPHRRDRHRQRYGPPPGRRRHGLARWPARARRRAAGRADRARPAGRDDRSGRQAVGGATRGDPGPLSEARPSARRSRRHRCNRGAAPSDRRAGSGRPIVRRAGQPVRVLSGAERPPSAWPAWLAGSTRPDRSCSSTRAAPRPR